MRLLLASAILCLASCGMSNHDVDILQDRIKHATELAQNAANVAGQPALGAIIGAVGAGATALAGLWHTNSGLPGTKRRREKRKAA